MQKYEIRRINAIYAGDCWYWNSSYFYSFLVTRANNVKRAFTDHLRREHGIVFLPGRTRIEFDGDMYEIQDRKTGEPLFAAIPV